MCGIAGLVDLERVTSAEELEVLARSMAGPLRHRGPDDEGAWVDAEAGVAFGHRRLSILDLTSGGHQPMRSADGRYTLDYNGELYNFRSLRQDLEARGHRFRTQCDTEVLLAEVVERGVDGALERFNGMFAFALWDGETRRLHLARDRMGEKPLYFGRVGSRFVFASELKGLLPALSCRPEVDRDSLVLFLRYGYVPAPRSIFRGIAKVEPGTLVTLDVGSPAAGPRVRPYWSLADAARRGTTGPQPADAAAAGEELHELLADAVRLRMVSDVPLGAFLSGGIDSSLVVALMQAAGDGRARTFTIGFNEWGFDEAPYAREVAKHLGTEHTELYVTPAEAMAVIPRLPAVYDEPFGDVSQIPTLLVSQLARRDVTVSLSGDGGDELFGGYDRYVMADTMRRRLGWLPVGPRRAVARAITAVPPGAWDAAIERAARLTRRGWGRLATGDRVHKLAEQVPFTDPYELFRRLVTHWVDPASAVRGGREVQTTLTDPAAWPALSDFTSQLMFLDAVTYLPGDILTKVDRATMAVSLEARVPLLDHRVVELAWRLPQELKVRDGRGKWLLRRLLDRHVPRELVDRPKMGFGVPIDAWLRGPLRGWAEELLDERRLTDDGFFAPGPVRAAWVEHLSGRRNWHYPLWDVLAFQAWLDAFPA